MPVDALKRLTPDTWRKNYDYFSKMQQLRGVPVINLHIWFDRKLSTIDNLIFSRSPLLSVYADMSTTCRDYAASSNNKSMLELVLAPAAKYMSKSDDEILQATMLELERLFPQEISATDNNNNNNMAKVVKFTLVRTPTSVYETVPGVDQARPSQVSPVPNFFCAGDFSRQRYLASMEGAILSGVLAAKAVAEYFQKQQNDNDNNNINNNTVPYKLTERPFNPQAADANDFTPDKTMYVATLATTVPRQVEEELESMNSNKKEDLSLV
jgi:15-cis-phytoene desaturase